MGPVAMALLLVVGWGAFGYSAWRRFRLLKVGAGESRCDHPGERFRRMMRYAIGQFRMRRYPLAGAAHMMIFSGFCVLLLRSIILWGRGFDADFHLAVFGPDQSLGKIYGLLKDVFVILVMAGSFVFLYYRTIGRQKRMSQSTEGLIIILIIIVMMFGDVLYDGASMVQHARAVSDESAGAVALVFHPWEPVGSVVQYGLVGVSDGAIVVLAHVGFWTHVALVLIFLNVLPYSKHFHVITAIPNVYLQELGPPGRLKPIEDIEGRVEREETLGIKRIDQFSWKAILDFYTCTECGRCTDHCPAANTGKKLSPKQLTVDLRDFLYENESALVAAHTAVPAEGDGDGSTQGEDAPYAKDLVGGVVDPEVLWACTTCRACEQECPVFITYVDKIVAMRQYLVQERGEFPDELQAAFRGLESSGNPWSFPAADRVAWAEGLDIKTVAEHPEAPVLFWVGCAAAFDERAKKVTRATAKLLKQAGVDFVIMGVEEQCTGDPARRAGNEFLFQMFAQTNVEMLNGCGADKKMVVTTCPHCYNTLKNEYPDFGGNYDVVHHTTFLARLIREGKLKPTRTVVRKVAFHDSCYLGRYNEVYDAPRDVLHAIPGLTVLEPTETRDRGMCCGAGGAQMFKEEESGSARVNVTRTEQLLDTQPDAISSACPFCMRMLTDGLAEKDREDLPQQDVAEFLLESVMTEEDA